jgi:hypothetical protein
LIIDINRTDERVARSRALLALRAQTDPDRRDRCTMEGFSDGGRLYGPLVGENAVPEKIYRELIRIGRNLRLRAENNFTQDVVFIYYECGERITDQMHAFRTYDSANDPQLKSSGIRFLHLRSFFADYLGSLVLLLDVARDPTTGLGVPAGDMVANGPADPHVAVVRFAWRDSPKERERKDDAWLVTELSGAWLGAKRLSDVVARLGRKFEPPDKRPRASMTYRDRLILDTRVARGLNDMPISK